MKQKIEEKVNTMEDEQAIRVVTIDDLLDGQPGELMTIVEEARARLIELRDTRPNDPEAVDEVYMTMYSLLYQWSDKRGIRLKSVAEGDYEPKPVGVVDAAVAKIEEAMEVIGDPPIECTAGDLKSMLEVKIESLEEIKMKGVYAEMYHDVMMVAVIARLNLNRWLELFNESFERARQSTERLN